MGVGFENLNCDEIESGISDTLPTFISDLKKKEEKYPTEIKELYSLCLPYCIDAGTCRDQEYEGKVEPGIAVLNRNAFIQYILEKYETPFDAQGKCSLHFIDIAGLRLSDQKGSADYILNKLSRLLKEEQITYCRYGGDEFAILFENENIIENNERFLEIKNRIRDSGINLKDIAETITVPTEEDKALLFWKQLKKGMILTQEDLDKISDIADSSTKTTRITNHPNIIKMRGLADKVGLTKELDGFIENIVHDKLLGAHVSNLNEFANEHLENNFSKVHVIEVSFLKETNDELGLAKGDELIYKLWEQLDVKQTENLRFFRRGSTILIAQRKNQEFDSDFLNKINEINLENNSLPVTYISRDLENTTLTDTKSVGLMLKEIFQNANYTWVKNELEKLHDPVLIKNENLPDMKNIKITNETRLKKWLYGKRQKERRTIILDMLHFLSEQDSDTDKLNHLKDIKNNIS